MVVVPLNVSGKKVSGPDKVLTDVVDVAKNAESCKIYTFLG